MLNVTAETAMTKKRIVNTTHTVIDPSDCRLWSSIHIVLSRVLLIVALLVSATLDDVAVMVTVIDVNPDVSSDWVKRIVDVEVVVIVIV